MNKASKINTPPIPIFRKLMDTTPNVTRAALAEYLGVSAVAIGQYYNGDALPSMDNLIKISKYFNVSTDYLLGLTDIKTTDTDLKSIAEYLCVDEDVIKEFDIFKIYKNLQNDFNEPPTTYNIMSYIFYDILSSTGEFGNCCMQYAEAIREKALYIKSFPDMHFSKELCTCVSQFGDLFYNSSSNNQKILLDYIDNDKRIKLMQLEMFEIISRWISECLDDEQIIECLGKDVEYQLNSPLAPFKEFADSYELYQKHPHERSGGNGKHKED